MWRFPERGVPPNHPFWIGIFHCKPTINGGTQKMSMDTAIWPNLALKYQLQIPINHHVSWFRSIFRWFPQVAPSTRRCSAVWCHQWSARARRPGSPARSPGRPGRKIAVPSQRCTWRLWNVKISMFISEGTYLCSSLNILDIDVHSCPWHLFYISLHHETGKFRILHESSWI